MTGESQNSIPQQVRGYREIAARLVEIGALKMYLPDPEDICEEDLDLDSAEEIDLSKIIDWVIAHHEFHLDVIWKGLDAGVIEADRAAASIEKIMEELEFLQDPALASDKKSHESIHEYVVRRYWAIKNELDDILNGRREVA